MKQTSFFKILGKILSIFAVIGALLAAVSVVPLETWQNFGKRAALLSIGMRRPAQSIQLLGNWEEHHSAGISSGVTATTATTASLGSGVRQPLTTTSGVQQKEGGGTVLTKQLSAGSTFIQGVAYKNSSKQNVDIAAVLKHKPAISFSQNSTAPQVLITHTHTTECYLGYDKGFYNSDDPTRTKDSSKNMVAVGEQVAKQLRLAGIGVIHDTEIHDAVYNQAYGHSKKEVEKLLKQYPTIRVVLDIHRDAIYTSDTQRIKPTVVIDGKKAAQVMIIVGMMNTKSVPNTHTMENLSFGVRLQQRLHTDYNGLMRPMVLANARYNQQLCNGMLLLEFGSDVNTLEEAQYSAELVGKGLAEVLRRL